MQFKPEVAQRHIGGLQGFLRDKNRLSSRLVSTLLVYLLTSYF